MKLLALIAHCSPPTFSFSRMIRAILRPIAGLRFMNSHGWRGACLVGFAALKAPAATYNDLWIPPTLTGTNFNLSLDASTRQFIAGKSTTTYSYNGLGFWGPTLIMNKGDVVRLHVTNNLIDTTTTHWHGFHIPAIMDGGPHQTIPPGTTWHPMFVVQNNAATYWYHPHLHEKTQEQLTRGAGGMIILRDPQEAALELPRTYGIDDVPLALSSRRFTTNGATAEFVTANAAYGDYLLANGTLNAQIRLPAQQVRLRILNAEIERSYNLGFSDGRTFHIIATDGGLVNAPIAVTRLPLAVGERAEILVDLGGDAVGSSVDLQSFNSGQARDFPGGEPAKNGQFGSLLNNTTFNILHIQVAAQTATAITKRPTVLTTNVFWTEADVTNSRTLRITGGFPGSATPLFSFDDLSYSPAVFNHTVDFNAVEQWTIANASGFSHAFHIHDIQFKIVARIGGTGAVGNYEGGWKDTLFVGQGSAVTFIARFDGFASSANPFMYHCHFSNHEDEGLMGQFLVVNHAIEDLAIASFTRIGANQNVVLGFRATPGTTYTLQYSRDLTTGSWKDIGSVTSDGTSARFTETDADRLADARGFYRVRIPVIP